MGNFDKINYIKGYYHKLDFVDYNACHHERKQKYLLLAKNEEPTRMKIL